MGVVPMFVTIILPLLSFSGIVHCRVTINSNFGTQSSRYYPDAYPEDSECIHRLYSRNNYSRIQVKFLEFDLYKANGDVRDPDDCDPDNDDHIGIYEVTDEKQVLLRRICGNAMPAPIMSTSNKIILEFKSYHRPKNVVSNCKYKFYWDSEVTDYGISSGYQADPRKCIFVYSSRYGKHGRVHSPNYPGYYPRSLDCVYIFHATEDEKLALEFTYFDVEGYAECTASTFSDFIVISEKGQNPLRFCGLKTPGRIESAGNSMEMLFHSNEVFEASGFEAYYEFIKKRPILVKIDTFDPELLERSTTISHSAKLNLTEEEVEQGSGESVNESGSGIENNNINIVFA